MLTNQKTDWNHNYKKKAKKTKQKQMKDYLKIGFGNNSVPSDKRRPDLY